MKQVVDSFLDAFNQKDIGGIMNALAEDVELTFIGADVYAGKTAARGFFEAVLWKQFPIIRASVNLNLAEGNHIVCEGELNGATSSGKEFKAIRFAEIFEIRSDKIARLTIYYDTPSMRAQVGKW